MQHRLHATAAAAAAAAAGCWGTPLALRRHVPHAAHGLGRGPHAPLGREVELLEGDGTPAAACNRRTVTASACTLKPTRKCHAQRRACRLPHAGAVVLKGGARRVRMVLQFWSPARAQPRPTPGTELVPATPLAVRIGATSSIKKYMPRQEGLKSSLIQPGPGPPQRARCRVHGRARSACPTCWSGPGGCWLRHRAAAVGPSPPPPPGSRALLGSGPPGSRWAPHPQPQL